MIAPQKVVKRLFPAGLTAGSCSSLQPGAITKWLSSLRKKAEPKIWYTPSQHGYKPSKFNKFRDSTL